MKRPFFTAVGLAGIMLFGSVIFTFSAQAQSVEELKQKIDEKGQAIQELEEEIDEYNREIVKVQAEKQTLNHTIQQLDLTRQKLLTDIAVTGNKIESTEYTIDKIQAEISGVQQRMEINNDALGQYVRSMDELDDKTLVEVVLSSRELSDFWNDIESLQQFRVVVSESLRELAVLKTELEIKRDEHQNEISSLQNLESKLSDQKQVVDINKRDKTAVLQQTKNQESEYQKILAAKLAAKEAFEKEIADYESQLKFILDKDKLPTLGSGVLGWPLQDVSLTSCYDEGGLDHLNCVTQYFGNTAFANSGAYNGSGHNGMDFRAAVGEPVYASADGTVMGQGDTDQYKGCYSYGQWVMLAHDNGLSTLYAHLSLRKVAVGQYVRKGEIIGYSGNTGYSTGPHLHYTVFASEGVNIVRLGDIKKITGCANASIPVAAYSAYLNPLDYLAR
jgi:murein DD-endopeptidase MepM/ murein hydrolase activator NlpD